VQGNQNFILNNQNPLSCLQGHSDSPSHLARREWEH
jgi:hypothetical protein